MSHFRLVAQSAKAKQFSLDGGGHDIPLPLDKPLTIGATRRRSASPAPGTFRPRSWAV